MLKNNKTLLFISTHIINKGIISEFQKLPQTMNCDSILVVDNTDFKFKTPNSTPITYINFFGKNIKCFLFDENINNSLKLPLFAAHKDNPDFKETMWANADYRFYYVRKFFPNYKYYWQFDYDVFCNGKSYKKFLQKFNKKKDDLIICSFRKEDKDSAWSWVAGVDWLYEGKELYGSFFPMCRMSDNAIDYLYKKRLEHKDKFINLCSENNKWPLCELFVPTELMKRGYKCSSINNKIIGLYNKNCNLSDDRIFEKPDNKLYHPVKSTQTEIWHGKNHIKYNILQKIFSVKNIYKDSEKYKQIYILFLKIKIK